MKRNKKRVQTKFSFTLLSLLLMFKLLLLPKSSSIDGLYKSNLKYSIAVSDYCFTVSLIPKSQDLNVNRKTHLNSTSLSATLRKTVSLVFSSAHLSLSLILVCLSYLSHFRLSLKQFHFAIMTSWTSLF